MKDVVAVSRCLMIKKDNLSYRYYFHFNGIFCGQIIKKIELSGSDSRCFTVGYDYLLLLKLLGVYQGILRGEMLKYRCLGERPNAFN